MENLSAPLLRWFDASHRVLPFRSDPTPYHVWVSEIMLQQTRVSAALPYYERFIRNLPDISALAACEPERLHKLWEGLGYYSRVRNLQRAAQIVCQQYGGELPANLAALRALPGIGDYTAGAIASIGFGIPAPAVDGNVLRVFARLCNDSSDITLPETKKVFTRRVMEHQPADRPGDYNQALMELGALICLPNGAPECEHCPLAALCGANAAGTALSLPVKAEKKPRRRYAAALALVQDSQGRWLLQQRPKKGLLAGLWQPLMMEPRELTSGESAFSPAPVEQVCALLPGAVLSPGEPLTGKHIFTHLEWEMTGWFFTAPCTPAPEGCVWASAAELDSVYTLPGAFKAFRPVMTGEG